MERSPERAAAILAQQEQAAVETLETLVGLSRGIYPRLLSDEGLPAALRSAAASSPMSVEVTESGIGRYAASVEAALYFCALEALQNAAKHSGSTRVRVRLDGEGDRVTLTMEDDGVGFDPSAARSGAGLANMRDRIEAVGGALTLESRAGSGTRITARLRAAQTSGVGVR
jgi:signal transduction histidine kinase